MQISEMRIFLYFSCLLFLEACGSSEDKKTESFYHAFPNNAWLASEPVKYIFEVSDTAAMYSISGKLRYKNDFSFSAMNLSASLSSKDGSIRKKTISLKMRDEKGENAGSEINGYLAIDFEIISSVKLNELGQWTLILNHDMPVDINHGLVGIEIILQRVQ